jgi:hypothetical protein
MAGMGFNHFFIIFAMPCFACMILIAFYRVNVRNETLEAVASKLTSVN